MPLVTRAGKGDILSAEEMDANLEGLADGSLITGSGVTDVLSSNVTFTPSGSGASERTVQSKLRDRLDIFDFIPPGLHSAIQAGTNTEDLTEYFDDAIAEAIVEKNKTVYLGSGRFFDLEGLVTITQGVMLMGDGSQGSTDGYGCVFRHHSTGGLFLWNGNGATAAGTGGGLKNVLLLKGTGFSGGDCIKLLATDDNHRPGEMVFDNALILGAGTGLWARGLHVDGSAATTSGSKGVRSINLRKFRVGDCTENNEYILLKQAVHVTGDHLQIDQADGTGTPGMTISGDSDNIILPGLICNGALVISPAAACNIYVSGRASSLNVTTANAVGVFSGSLGTLTANSSAPVTGSGFRVFTDLGIESPITSAEILKDTAAAGNAFTARFNSSSERSGIYSNAAGQTYFGENINYSGGDTYSQATWPAARWGNPAGSGSIAWQLDVAPNGTAGNAISWTKVIEVDENGVTTFPAGAVRSSHATAGIGYATGAGGTVAQGDGSGKATGVELNKATGEITMDDAELAAATTVSFTLTNSAIAATDHVLVSHVSAGTLGAYTCTADAAAGSATIYVRNVTAGALSEAIVLKFTVIKAVTS